MSDIDQPHIYSHNGTIPAGATTLSFGTTASGGAIVCGTVGILNGSSTATLYVQLNGTAATTGSETLALFPGTGYQYVGVPIHSISIIGSASGDPYSVCAY